MRPLIGLTSSIQTRGDDDCPHYRVQSAYVQAVINAGGSPLLVPSAELGEWLDNCYAELHGILLTGGDDVDPRLYRETPHPKLGPTNLLRDRVEIRLIEQAMADRKPMLAICRGMQILNVALGGSLYQDLASQCPDSAPHEEIETSHEINLVAGSRLSRIIGGNMYHSNSFHHQGIKTCADLLTIAGRTSDGTIEAVEGSFEHFVVGVQSHPELMIGETKGRPTSDDLIFAAFVKAAKDYANRD